MKNYWVVITFKEPILKSTLIVECVGIHSAVGMIEDIHAAGMRCNDKDVESVLFTGDREVAEQEFNR